MRKILITGALGQLGNALIEQLNNKYLLVPTDLSYTGEYQNYQKLDISRISDIENLILNEAPDVIINLAAMTNVDACELSQDEARTINTESVNHMLSIHNGKFIQISTDYVFDGASGPYSENDTTNPINIYGKTKWDAEDYIKNSSKDWCIVRTNVLFDYNQGTKASFVKWVIDSLSDEKTINVVNDQWNNPVWTKDFAKVIEHMLVTDVKGIYHYGGADYLNRFEFAKLIANIFELNTDLIKAIDTKCLNQPAKRPLKGGLLTNKIEKDLNININKLQASLIEIKSLLTK